MSSSKIRPEADNPSVVDTDSGQTPGTFLRNVLKSHSDRLYDLPENIQDSWEVSVRTGTNEENKQGTLRTYGIWYMPHV